MTDSIIFLVTGATGWMGRSVLHELQKLIPPNCFNDRVFAFGSKSGTVYSTAYENNSKISIPIYSLSDTLLLREAAKSILYIRPF